MKLRLQKIIIIKIILFSIKSFASNNLYIKKEKEPNLDSFVLVPFDFNWILFGKAQDIFYGKPLMIRYQGFNISNNIEYLPILSKDIFFDNNNNVISKVLYSVIGVYSINQFTYFGNKNLKTHSMISFNPGTFEAPDKYFWRYKENGQLIEEEDNGYYHIIKVDSVYESENLDMSFFNSKGQIIKCLIHGDNESIYYDYDSIGRIKSIKCHSCYNFNFQYTETDVYGNWTKMEFLWHKDKYQINRQFIYRD